MYRRKAGEAAPTSGGAGTGRTKQTSTSRSGLRRGPLGGGDRDGSTRLSPPVILTIGCLILFGSIVLLSILSPTSKDQILKAEKIVEDEYKEFFGGGEHESVIPPVPQNDGAAGGGNKAKSMDATQRMLQHDSSWVDGEKKLKKQLKILAARQAEGKDLGVPVLTRWLGDDIPAWAGEGVNVEEWKKKVDAKYAEMREEENLWRARVAQYMEEK